jgi:hypothetical protein
MNNIKVKIPTSALFIPMEYGDWKYFILGGVYVHNIYECNDILSSNFNSLLGRNAVTHEIKRKISTWVFPNYELNFFSLQCYFENRIIPVDDFEEWFSNNLIQTRFFNICNESSEYSQRYKPSIMSLLEYYIKQIDPHIIEDTNGYDTDYILGQWMNHPASGFQQTITVSGHE